MYDFSSKYICLVLTCNKPQYAERREKHSHIYSQISEAGFEVVFLYADPSLDSFHIVKNEYYELTVPTEESYGNLTNKMKLAYSFFNMHNIKGILKIDDDVYHIDEECLDNYYYDADYLGINQVDISTQYLIKKDTLNKFAFSGPYYWVSKKGIGYIVSDDSIEHFNAEDVYTGFTLCDKSDIKRFNTNWYKMGYVKYLDGLKI